MIHITNLHKSFNAIKAVDISELRVAVGESMGLAGNNGAGKTTLFRMLLDLIRPDGGQVLSKALNVSASDAWKAYTGSYLDEGFLIGFLTADEYFEFVGKLHGLNRAEVLVRLRWYEEFFNDEILGKKKYLRDLSKGNQKKVGIAAAMLIEPEVLILDEPFANLDPTTQIRLKLMLRRFHKERNATLLISSHDLNHVTEVCERMVVLEKGQIVQDMRTNQNTLKELEAYFAV